MPCVARKKKYVEIFTPRAPMGSIKKNVSPFGPAVWPAIAKIYTYVYKRKA